MTHQKPLYPKGAMIFNPQALNRGSKLFPAAFFVLIIFFPASAVSSPISMETFLGFDGVFSLNKWTPLHIVLENRGRTIGGILEVVVTSGSEFKGDVHDTTYVTEVELPTRSKKMYRFTIYIDSFIHPLSIRLKQADSTVIAKSLNLRPHYTDGKLNLFLGIENVPDFSSMPVHGILPVMTHKEFLPERWYGYDGVDVVVLDATVIESLRDKQLIALTDWIKRGGRLITAGGLNYGSLLKQRTKPLLPINVLGYKRLFEMNSLEKFCGQRLVSSAGFLVLEVDLEGALPLAQEGDTPVILQKTFGLGRIIFLAFDFDSSPFSEWSGRQAFWTKILAVKTSPENPGSDLEEEKILSAMISSLPARLPAFGVVLIFLAVYVILVQTVFIRLKKNGEQRRKHLFSLLLIITLFSLSSYRLFLYKNTKKDPSYNSFLHMRISDQSMTGRVQYFGGLYGLKSGTHRLDFGSSFYPIIPIGPDEPRDIIVHTLTFHENGDVQILEISLEPWSHRFLKLSEMIPFQIRRDVFLDDQGLHITVENMTTYTVVDCQIYYAGRFFSFGDIAPGKKRIMRLSRAEIDKSPSFQSETAVSLAEEMVGDQPFLLLENLKKNFLESLLLQIHSRYQTKKEVFYLFGWITSNLIPNPLIPPGIDGEGVTLIEWETHVKPRTE